MKDELSLRQIFNEIILFFISFRLLIFSITLVGILFAFLYLKFESKYYEVTAIATSGISEFERIPLDKGIYLNQRTAINLINHLDADVRNNDLSLLSKKLDVSEEILSNLKRIEAVEILREEMQEKNREVSTQKFEIKIMTTDNKIIPLLQEGIKYYFQNNNYVRSYYELYQSTISEEIKEINNEIKQLRDLRGVDNSSYDISSINVFSRKKPQEASNEIIDLIQLRTIKITNKELLQPITYIQGFSLVEKATKRNASLFLLQIGIISFLFSVIVAIFKNVSNKLG